MPPPPSDVTTIWDILRWINICECLVILVLMLAGRRVWRAWRLHIRVALVGLFALVGGCASSIGVALLIENPAGPQSLGYTVALPVVLTSTILGLRYARTHPEDKDK